jgi:homoserine kinase type II
MAMARRGLDFVPRVEVCRNGDTLVQAGGRLWEVTTWMPGAADFHRDPSDAKLAAAVSALARIHEAWSNTETALGEGPCPANRRRWRALRDGEAMLRIRQPPRLEATDPLTGPLHAAWRLLPMAIKRMTPIVSSWLDQPVPLQPCLCDVWHDHILFDGNRVTGVIDYAAAKVDHVAADLARLLSSLIPDERERFRWALNVYRSIRPLPNPELIELLDAAGVVGAVVNWLQRIESKAPMDRAAVAGRMEMLVQRLPNIASFYFQTGVDRS